MLKAIHKETNKLVPAFKLEEDASWIGKEKEEWIAPYPEIDNWKFLKEKGINEVEVSFVKSYRKEDGTPYRSHFRILTEHAIPCKQNESEEHKLAKEGIYEDVLDNLLKINGKGIRDLFQIEDIDFEYRLSKSKFSKIADVIVTFKEKDAQYGKGIVFEIQFSRQNFEQTDDRTYDRITEGYSVVWLWDGLFEENNKLKDKEIRIIPFLKGIEEYREKKAAEFYNEINSFGQIIDKKMEEAKEIFGVENKKLNYYYHEINSLSDRKKEEISSLQEEVKENIKIKFLLEITDRIKEDESIKNVLKNLIDYKYLANIISNKEIESVKEKLQINFNKELEKEITSQISEEVINKALNKVLEEIQLKYNNDNFKHDIFIECEKCHNKFPVKSVQFEKGKCYCYKCFDELPVNWLKIQSGRSIKEEVNKGGQSKIS